MTELAVSQLCGGLSVAYPVKNAYTYASFALTALSFMACAGWIGVLMWLRKTPVMQISQWHLLLGYVVSFMCMNCSAVVRTANSYKPFSDMSCVAWEWLVHVPLSFVLGVLTVKEYRTLQLRVKTRRLQKTDLPTPYIVGYLSSTFVIACIILSIWTALDPPSVDPCLNYQCNPNNFAAFWTLIGFQGLQLFILLVIAYKDYNQGTVGGEGLGILINAASVIIYFATVLAATVSNPTSRSDGGNELNDSNSVEAFVNAFMLFLATTVSLGGILLPKLRYRHLPQDEILRLFLEKGGSGSSKRPASGKSEARPDPGPTGKSVSHGGNEESPSAFKDPSNDSANDALVQV
ncbi:Metabotropic glutamate receptor-like protein E [Hondaea fermentalgiana]|uniref:Metabotropic glutamate receptor-like protein E n=1 Tax=Hondaea fermentalgiana TaxID=2315210 RepID=A0A2R5GIM1_9STRA|nr:Metabotropic glutamate receptor-like protein E [Hondaea fermentalgiana]|eukprot:GBG28503.1 Metabotropic glutamate receptor-like protein E [Hondaea fermentalgiana]